MKVTDHLKKTDSTVFSIEILPHLKGKSIYKIDAIPYILCEGFSKEETEVCRHVAIKVF